MIKNKLIFLVLFLLVFQLSFSSVKCANEVVNRIENSIENHLLFENTYITQNITEELTKDQIDDLYKFHSSRCFLSNNNSKDFNFTIVHVNLLFNSVMSGHLFHFSLSKKVMNVPIYLQTEEFRL